MSHDGAIGEETFATLTRPTRDDGSRPCALAILGRWPCWGPLVVFRLLSTGFSNRMLREHLAPLLGVDPAMIPAGRMTYDLRRLREHHLIARTPHTHRYMVTDEGLRIAVFLLSVQARILRPGLALLSPPASATGDAPLRAAFDHLEDVMNQWCLCAGVPA